MIEVILGLPKRGKSQFAEAQLSRYDPDSVLYVGTLPVFGKFVDLIEQHQRRRPKEWSLIELNGDIAQDVRSIQRAAGRYRAILVDGLSFYLSRLDATWQLQPGRLKLVLDRCLRRFSGPFPHVLVVDTPAPQELRESARRVVLTAHSLLYEHAARLTFVDFGKATPLTAASAVDLDRSPAEQPSLLLDGTSDD